MGKEELTGQQESSFVLEPRASSILYHFLASNKSPFPYLLPANICPIVPATFSKAGQAFQFLDIDPATFSLDEKVSLELVRNQKKGGVCFVHAYGEAASHSEFFSNLKNADPELLIIDDRCLCKPIFIEPNLDNIDLILYSTGYGKYVDVGSGGFGWLKPGVAYQPILIPFNKSDLDKLEQGYKVSIQDKSFFHFRESNWLDTHPLAMDFKSYSAKVLGALVEVEQKKPLINQIYREQLPVQIQLPEIYNQWRFNIQVSNKTEVLQALFANDLFASSHYASLGGIMAEGQFPFAEALHEHIINLFNDQNYSLEQAQRTAAIINQTIQ